MQAQIIVNVTVKVSMLEAFETSIKNTPLNEEWGLFHTQQVCETIKGLFSKLETKDKLDYILALENRGLEAEGQEADKLLHLVQTLTGQLNEHERFMRFLAER